MKYIKYIILAFVISLYSCNDWLDIQPETESSEKDLFSSVEGYRNAINGIYLNLTSASLYGQNLTWGFMSCLEQYTTSDITKYQKASDYDYNFTEIQEINNSIWSKAYNTILNCNNFIENLESFESDLFAHNEKEMLLGEAKGVRAMLYLDLVRLYAQAPVSGDALAVPYYGFKTSAPQPALKTSEILNNVISELKEASTLLIKADTNPIVVKEILKKEDYRFYRRKTDLDKCFNHRGFRFNYYASLAMLSRAYMYAGDKKESYEYAKKVLDYEIFTFNTEKEMSKPINERDVKMSKDVIFGLYDYDLVTNYSEVLNYKEDEGYMVLKDIDELFSDNKSDFRNKYLILKNPSGNFYSIKHTVAEGMISDAADDRKMIPMIRLSELYYNMAEYLLETSRNDAYTYFNELRVERGITSALPEDLSDDEFIRELLMDARKEFIIEGQVFYMYKRLNMDINTGKNVIGKDKIGFTLPYPNVEINLN